MASKVAPYEAYEFLLTERTSDGVLLVTMNRPEALNAMTYAMHTELAGIWSDIATDDETRAVVITGAGRGFSAGNDLKQPNPTTEQIYGIMREAHELVYGIVKLEKPVIAAINGAAVGAGLAVALVSDITIAAEDAKLIDGHTMNGSVAGDHACLVWPLLTSMAKAKYYLLTCDTISGTEAERIGLVTMALPGEDVLPRAMEIAARLARGSQSAIGGTKRALNHWYLQASPIFELSAALELNGFFHPDVEAARTAFREKREVTFTG